MPITTTTERRKPVPSARNQGPSRRALLGTYIHYLHGVDATSTPVERVSSGGLKRVEHPSFGLSNLTSHVPGTSLLARLPVSPVLQAAQRSH